MSVTTDLGPRKQVEESIMNTGTHVELDSSDRSPAASRCFVISAGDSPARPFSKSLTKKASLNALTEVVDYGMRLVVGFVVTPLLVAGLGPYFFGVWQVLARLTGYITAADGRPAQALKWSIARRQASTDYQEKRRCVGSAIAVWFLFLPVLSVVGMVFVWFAPFWLQAPVEQFATIRMTTGLLVASLILTGLIGMPRAVLRGENLDYKRIGISAMLTCLGGGLMVLALYWDTGLVGVATATAIKTVLGGLLFFHIVRVFVPWFGIAWPTIASVRQFIGLSGWFLAWRVVHQVMLASDIVLLGMLGSAELVSVYTLSRYTPEILTSVAAIVAGGAAPGLGGILGSGNPAKAAKVRGELLTIIWLVTTVAGAAVLLWNRSFVSLWVGPEYFVGTTANVLIMLAVSQFVLLRCDAQVIDLTLKLRNKVVIGAVSAVISVGAAVVALTVFDGGIVGLCLAFLAGRSILTVAYPWIVGRFLGISGMAQLQSLVRPAVATVVLFSLTPMLSHLVAVRSWLGFVLSVAATLPVVGLFALGAGLTSGQRKCVFQRLRGGL